MANQNAVSIRPRDNGFHRAAEFLERLTDARHFFEAAREIGFTVVAAEADENLPCLKNFVALS